MHQLRNFLPIIGAVLMDDKTEISQYFSCTTPSHVVVNSIASDQGFIRRDARHGIKKCHVQFGGSGQGLRVAGCGGMGFGVDQLITGVMTKHHLDWDNSALLIKANGDLKIMA